MIENYAVVNKTDNLIPIVNTKLKGKKRNRSCSAV